MALLFFFRVTKALWNKHTLCKILNQMTLPDQLNHRKWVRHRPFCWLKYNAFIARLQCQNLFYIIELLALCDGSLGSGSGYDTDLVATSDCTTDTFWKRNLLHEVWYVKPNNKLYVPSNELDLIAMEVILESTWLHRREFMELLGHTLCWWAWHEQFAGVLGFSLPGSHIPPSRCRCILQGGMNWSLGIPGAGGGGNRVQGGLRQRTTWS